MNLFIFAPSSFKYLTTSSFLYSRAIDNGVLLYLSSLFISAPCSTKYLTIASFPLLHGRNIVNQKANHTRGIFPFVETFTLSKSTPSRKGRNRKFIRKALKTNRSILTFETKTTINTFIDNSLGFTRIGFIGTKEWCKIVN